MAGLWFRMFRVDRIEDRVTMHGVQTQLVMGELRTESGMLIQVKQGRSSATTATENGVALDEEQLLFLAGGHDNAVDEDVDKQPVQDLTLNVDNVFQADDCDAFDSDVDEAPTAQTMFMANLSSANPVYDEAGPSYDSEILYEVHDHDHYQDAVCEHHEEHKMHDEVQPNYVVDSHADYTSNSNMIPYDQYVKDNAVPVVQSNVSSVTNDAYMMIYNDMCEPHAQYWEFPSPSPSLSYPVMKQLANKEKIDLKNQNLLRDSEWLGRVVHCITGSMMSIFNVSNHLSDSGSICTYDINIKAFHVKPKVIAPGKYDIDVVPIPPRNRNNREVHLYYLKHLKESVETLREIVEEAKVERPLDRSLASACLYTKHSQE
ncbi:hypothetical protein Tco_0404252 [Tanacetum coccineum]